MSYNSSQRRLSNRKELFHDFPYSLLVYPGLNIPQDTCLSKEKHRMNSYISPPACVPVARKVRKSDNVFVAAVENKYGR